MPLARFRSLFHRSVTMPFAANDDDWDLAAPASGLRDAISDSEKLSLRITDFDLHQRDLGAEQAAQLQRLVFERLQPELTANETLVILPNGAFELMVRDAARVDTDKLLDHLMDSILGEAFSLNRCLIECELTADA